MIKSNIFSALLILIIAAIVSIIASSEFIGMRTPDKIFPSSGLSKIGKLSDFLARLENTSGNATVYYFDSGKPGATVFLLGGSHPNEAAGFITALLLIENAVVERGKLIIIPQTSLSGFSYTDPLEAYPKNFTLNTKSGERQFRFGSRGLSPIDQWPDPRVYLHYPSGQKLSGVETRNLNRAYPGRPDGSLTQQIAFAIMELIRKENVDIAFDLHEAAPEIPIINAIVTHEKGRDIAASAVLSLEMEELQYALEISPKNFRGLSHREWGDHTNVTPFLMETSNPIQGRLRGKTKSDLIIDGMDKNYEKAAQLGRIKISYSLNGEQLSKRVARHLEGFKAIIISFEEYYPEKIIIMNNIPKYNEIITNGVGSFLH